MVRDSSAEAFYDESRQSKGAAQCRLIERLLLERGPMTGQMLSQATGLVPGTISARIVELRDLMGVVVELDDKRMCPVTGRVVRWVAHKDTAANQQIGLPLAG